MPRGLNYDNKILSIVNTAVDMLILGIFWFVTSIPLVTIGASTTAVYYTVKYSLQGTTQGNGLTGGVPPVRFSM